ncbi:MAG: hypothetical protein WC656_11775 [Sulfurimonas sp.]|jgi:hypothetical protein
MSKLFFLFFFTLISLFAKDVTQQIEFVGNPYKEQFADGAFAYSRNVWDLQMYNNLLFIGAGNSANEGPSKNSGNLNLYAYNPKTNGFNSEAIIYDDQIDIFKVLQNQLFIPGNDATGSWEWGNIYLRLANQKWQMYRNLPHALHVYDLTLHDNKIFAGIGLNEGAAVGVSNDLGKSWKVIPLGESRVYSFLHLGKELFALKKFKTTSQPYFSVAQYQKDGSFMPRFDISIYDMFPDTKFDIKYSRATRIISFDDKAIYLGAYKYNSHQTKPFGLYVAKLNNNKLNVKKIELKKGTIPRDIIKRDDAIYVLCSKNSGDKVTIEVLEFVSNDFSTYKELFSFEYNSFARSFELHEGNFYFGIGSDVDEGDVWKMEDIKKETGNILKYKWK